MNGSLLLDAESPGQVFNQRALLAELARAADLAVTLIESVDASAM